MYLHLGQDTVVKSGDIIGVFDIESSTVNKDTRRFLARCETEKRVVNVTDDLPKAVVLCDGGSGNNGERLYVSQISPATLLKRARIAMKYYI